MTLTTDRQQFEQWWETAMHNGYPPRFGWEHWREGDGYRDDDGEFQGLWQAWVAGREALANREAQPVACDIERIKRHALPAGECPRQSQVVLLSSLQRLLTAPPAPAVPSFDEWLESTGTHPVGWVREAMEESYNACRAAILEAAPEGGNDA